LYVKLNAQQPPDFNAEKAAGIFEYDIDEVIKKLKISDESDKRQLTEALKIYNGKMFDLSIEHASTFKELEMNLIEMYRSPCKGEIEAKWMV
jgi:hypothetical protein